MAHYLHTINNMRVAISCWQNCIAPVFDTSENVLLFDITNLQVAHSASISLDSESPFARAKVLSERGVDVLICGAISQTLKMAVAGQNIEIISYVFGPLENTMTAFISGQLQDGCEEPFPGHQRGRCHRNRRRKRGNHGFL